MKQIVSAIYLRSKYVQLNLKLVVINLRNIDIVSFKIIQQFWKMRYNFFFCLFSLTSTRVRATTRTGSR